jgi:hypothetical protein
LKELRKFKLLEKGEKPLRVNRYTALSNLDMDLFLGALQARPYSNVLLAAQSQMPLLNPDSAIDESSTDKATSANGQSSIKTPKSSANSAQITNKE